MKPSLTTRVGTSAHWKQGDAAQGCIKLQREASPNRGGESLPPQYQARTIGDRLSPPRNAELDAALDGATAEARSWLDNSPRLSNTAGPMATNADAPLDQLWKEYGQGFSDFDDLTLARWLAQTLGQLKGKAWRHSHPLLGAYRLAAQLGHERQIWHMRLVALPPAYSESACCRAPMLPLLTRDVQDAGLICQHCSETLVPFDEIPADLQSELGGWAAKYAPVHAVAHWDDRQRKGAGDYDHAYENAAEGAEELLAQAGRQFAPRLLDFYAAVVWEDQDECLEVRPEDVQL